MELKTPATNMKTKIEVQRELSDARQKWADCEMALELSMGHTGFDLQAVIDIKTHHSGAIFAYESVLGISYEQHVAWQASVRSGVEAMKTAHSDAQKAGARDYALASLGFPVSNWPGRVS